MRRSARHWLSRRVRLGAQAPATADSLVDGSRVDEVFASLAGGVRVDPFTLQVHAAQGGEAGSADLWQDNWALSFETVI